MDLLTGLACKLNTFNHSYDPITTRGERSILSDKIQIVSYNIKALFPFYDIGRILVIVDYIEDLFIEKKADIVCLQEAFELDLYTRLYEIAEKLQLNIVHPPLDRRFGIGENSGLVTMSRFPVKSSKFIRHDQSEGLCWFAEKGAHYIRFVIGEKSLRLVNTHLQADNESVSINQFNKLIVNITFDGAMIVGDLNMKYDTVSKLKNIKCVNSQKRVTFPEYNEQLDYVLLYDLDLDCTFEVFTDIKFSDHYPIRTTFVLK
jgi:endonuclease/exonuclease/phosphatase family metal-dependent hydrolase